MSASVAQIDRSALALTREVIGLFKLRIGALITLTALVGMAVAPGAGAGAFEATVLALSVLVASAGAGAFNQYYECDSDRLMARTRGRAFVTGALPRSPAWLLPIGLMIAGSVAGAWYLLNPVAALFVFLGAFFYGVVYTVWLKRRTWWNIVVGGLAGSFAVLAGAAAADPAPSPQPLLLALVLFLWTPPHFWSLAIANQADYAAAGVPMLPVVVGTQRAARAVYLGTIALLAASLLPIAFGSGPVYAIAAASGGLYFVAKSRRLAHAPTRQNAIGSFLASLVQLGAVLAGASLDAALR